MLQFNEHMKELRKKKGLTQKELARQVGLSEQGIQNYELGKRKPEFDALIKLADYFDISIDYLVGRTENPERL